MSQPQHSLDAILAKFPTLLSPAEQQLPVEQRNAILRQRVHIMLQKQQAQRKASQPQPGQQAQQQRPPQPVLQGQPVGGQPVRPNAQAGASQSPRVMQMNMKGQPVQMTPQVSVESADADLQLAEQMRQQQQIQNMIAHQQRLTQQQQQQQQQGTPQMQASQLAPTPGPVATPMQQQLSNIATPSPQANQSPLTNAGVLDQSPVAQRMQPAASGGAGPGMNPGMAGGPVPAISMFSNDPTKIIEQMPQLLKARQTGQMSQEMAKTVSRLVLPY